MHLVSFRFLRDDDADDLKNGYSFQALSPVFSPDELRNAKTVVVTPSLLQLPDTLPQRVKDLAADITRGKTNDYDKLEAIHYLPPTVHLRS